MIEDALVITLQTIACIFVVIVVASTTFMWIHRDEMIIKSTILPVNTLFGIGCILNIVLALFTTAGSIPCIPYLYGGFVSLVVMGASFIAFAWCTIARVAVTRRLLIEASVTTLYDAEHDVSKMNEYQLNVREEEIKNQVKTVIKSRKLSWIENWLAMRDWTKEPITGVCVWFLFFGVSMVIPIVITIMSPVYQTLDGECSNRTQPEIIGLVLVITITIIALIYIIIKIWKLKSAYGEKSRLIALIFTWILLTFLVFAVSSGSEAAEISEKILSIGSIIVLWCIENVMALFMMIHKRIMGSSGSTTSLTFSDESSSSELRDSQQPGGESKKRFQSLYSILLYDYHGKDDPVLQFADTRGLAHTILFIRSWHGRKIKAESNPLLGASHAYLQYADSVKVDGRYPMYIVNESRRESLDKLADEYQKTDGESETINTGLMTAMNELEVETMELLEDVFLKEYVKTNFYRDFIAKKEAHDTLKHV